MVKSTTDFAERNSEQITNVTRKITNATRTGVDWVQELTEQNIRQAQAMVITTRKVADDLWEQGSTIRQHSFAVAEATLSNTLDFLQKLSRLKELRELTLIQSAFVTSGSGTWRGRERAGANDSAGYRQDRAEGQRDDKRRAPEI